MTGGVHQRCCWFRVLSGQELESLQPSHVVWVTQDLVSSLMQVFLEDAASVSAQIFGTSISRLVMNVFKG